MIPIASDYINQTGEEDPIITVELYHCALHCFADGSCALINQASDASTMMTLTEAIRMFISTRDTGIDEFKTNELHEINEAIDAMQNMRVELKDQWFTDLTGINP
jgi:hypothetical protein